MDLLQANARVSIRTDLGEPTTYIEKERRHYASSVSSALGGTDEDAKEA